MRNRFWQVGGEIQRTSNRVFYSWQAHKLRRCEISWKIRQGSMLDHNRLGVGRLQIDTLKRKCREEGFL